MRNLRRRPRRHQINRLLCQALEPRTLFSTFTVTDSGNTTTNGTNLKNVLNGIALDDSHTHTLQYGDTIILSAGVTYYSHVAYTLSNLTAGTGTVTIETSSLGSLPSGRIGPANASLLPKLTSDSGTSILQTATSDGTGTWVPVHDVTLVGIEIAPSVGTKTFNSPFVALGDNSTKQNTAAQVPYNFTIDRCYIHGYDDYGALANTYLSTNYKSGVGLNSNYTTVENSYISDIHNTGQDAQAINGANGLGNFTITNNFLEGTGENIIFGGNDSHMGVGVDANNISVTHNLFFKRLVWDPYDPSYLGVHMSVKNLFELKHATNVLLDQNLLENCWVGADQIGEAIIVDPKDQNGTNTWTLIHDVTITNNIIENVGVGMELASATQTASGYTTLPMYNLLVRNNLIETVAAGPTGGNGEAFFVGGSYAPGANITIDHNTTFNSSNFMTLGSSMPYPEEWYNFTVTNNVADLGHTGIFSSPGEGAKAFNTFESGITMTNVGSGYTSAPTVTFVGGLGAGGVAATGVALVNATSVNGVTANTVYNIQITNNGSGYTSAPTIVFGNTGTGGSNAAATATVDLNSSDYNYGKVVGWNVTGNVFFGNGTTTATSLYPAGNFISSATATEDMIGLQDPAGQLAGLLSTSPFYTDGVDVTTGQPNGSTPGVNMSALSGIADFVALDSTVSGYWKFDEGTGASVSDSSGHGKTGTFNGSASWNTTTGQSANALALTGGTSGDVSISSFSTTSSFSFAAWVNPTNFSATQYIASAANSAFSLSINTSGKLVAAGKTGSVTASTAMTAGTWYLVGVTFDGATLTVYQNGVAVGSVAATTATGSTTLYLGGNKGAVSSFNGSIDEARYYTSNMSTTDLNGNSGMLNLFNNFGPIITSIPWGGSPITSTTTVFNVSAVDHAVGRGNTNSSPSPLSFSWSLYSFDGVQGNGSIGLSGATNGTNAAQNITISWASGAGTYILLLTVTDGHGGISTALHPITVTGLTGAPAAPTNIAATPGASSVTVTWTNNAGTNETGFDVQRYDTDNGWLDLGNVAAGATTYSDTTAATDGTAYLYQVAAFNGSGQYSNYDATTCAVSCPIAYEGFNYSSVNGANPWSGGNTGLGFSGTWTLNSTANSGITTGSLTFTNNSHALTTSANGATLKANSTTATQTLTTTVGTAGSILWLGFEFSTASNASGGQVRIGTSTNMVETGMLSGILQTYAIIGSNTWKANSTIAAANNTTYFLVTEIQYLTSGDVITLWVNPQPSSGAPSNYLATATTTLPATQQLATTNSLILAVSGSAVETFDEIRLGLSYASVAPDPLVTPSSPTYTAAPIANSLTTPATLPTHALFQSFLTAIPTLNVTVNPATIKIASDYHLAGAPESDGCDSNNPTDLTADPSLMWIIA